MLSTRLCLIDASLVAPRVSHIQNRKVRGERKPVGSVEPVCHHPGRSTTCVGLCLGFVRVT